MNFRSSLSLLALSGILSAQMVQMKPDGGGTLKIGDTSYRLDLMDLQTTPAKGATPGLVRLQGNLLPPDGSRPFHITLTLMKNGSLFMLNIGRKAPGAYPDSWAATQKTCTRVIKLEDRPGGRVEFKCEGPLTGVISQKPAQAEWSGRLWAVFPGGS